MHRHDAAAAASGQAQAIGARWAWAGLAVLLVLCALHGWLTVRGLAWPPDVDSLRDLGFISAFRRGEWWHDPLYGAEWRWYPPLIDAAGALISRVFAVSDRALPAFWVQAGAWLNLLTPTMFFVMGRRLLGTPWAALAATAWYVLFAGSFELPWTMGGYTPWPFAPSLTQGLFFLALWQIIAWTPPAEGRPWAAALAIGATIGLTGLANPVPAMLASAVVTGVAFARDGLRLRPMLWLAGVAAAEVTVMLPYIAVVLLHYPAGIANGDLVAWTDSLLNIYHWHREMVVNAPGLLCAAAVLVLWRRGWLRLERAAVVALMVWPALCGLALGRHHACQLPHVLYHSTGGGPVICRVLVIPPSHFHLYLQDAWACFVGLAVARAGAWAFRGRAGGAVIGWRPAAFGLCVGVAVLAGIGGLFARASDVADAAAVRHGSQPWFDLTSYRWIIGHTDAADLFLTRDTPPTGGDDVLNSAGGEFAVIAAGRQMVAAPELFSNPYVSWPEREAWRRQALADLRSERFGSPALSRLCVAAAGDRVWLLLPAAQPVANPAATAVFHSRDNAIYRLDPALLCHPT